MNPWFHRVIWIELGGCFQVVLGNWIHGEFVLQCSLKGFLPSRKCLGKHYNAILAAGKVNLEWESVRLCSSFTLEVWRALCPPVLSDCAQYCIWHRWYRWHSGNCRWPWCWCVPVVLQMWLHFPNEAWRYLLSWAAVKSYLTSTRQRKCRPIYEQVSPELQRNPVQLAWLNCLFLTVKSPFL